MKRLLSGTEGKRFFPKVQTKNPHLKCTNVEKKTLRKLRASAHKDPLQNSMAIMTGKVQENSIQENQNLVLGVS